MEKTALNMDTMDANKGKITAKSICQKLLLPAGVKINGNQPWDIQIHNDDFYNRVLSEGVLGLGESYMDKWWDCDRLDIFFEKILRENIDTKVKIPLHFKLKRLLAIIINYQTKQRAKVVAYQHYDLGNDLFIDMLDKQMIYSCGYWKEAHTLDDAQTAKLELICQKLQLKPGMRLLDIGCGWGGLAKYAAEKYGVSVVGLTISQQQFEYAQQYCKGLPIEIRLQDYRDLSGSFDRIVSVGMFEHVGYLNYKTFMQIVHRTLTDDGLFLLHTIGVTEAATYANEWITKYIFPNGMLPSPVLISKAAQQFFVMEDWHNFGAYYDPTLMAWYENFNKHWQNLKAKYDERFYRMWSYYLLSCAGSFRARTVHLWQIVFSKKGINGGYLAPR